MAALISCAPAVKKRNIPKMTPMKKARKRAMRYVLTPLNAGQEMNCHVKVVRAKTEAVQKAIGIAAALQAHLEGNTITCRVLREGRGWEITDTPGRSIIVTPSGQVLDEFTGDPVKL
jgi:ribosomal protein L19